MAIRVESEIGRLRRVLVHRPGREIDWMVPSMMERLLFDDILYGEAARCEHDRFRGVLHAAGVETVEPQELLADLLGGEVGRGLLARLESAGAIDAGLHEELATLAPEALAETLIAGLRHEPPAAASAIYRLPPVPNYFFQRDPQVVIGERVVVAAMATEAREREPLLGQLLFEHHPALSGYADLTGVEGPDRPGRRPTLEGGDVLVASPEVLLVGLSLRTNRWGVEALASYLRRQRTAFRYMLVVELPQRRSTMHLDTVFTFVDHGLCLAYLPVIQPDGAESGHVYRIDLRSEELTYTVCSGLPEALSALGIEVDLVPCGGAEDPIEQQREQWTDGANAFALAPGVILLYRRNRRTAEEFAKRGWRVLSEEQVLEAGEPLLGHGPTVVTIRGHELSRARGGPRCMTMPLERDPLG